MNAMLSLFLPILTIVYAFYGSYLLFTDIAFSIIPHPIILTTVIVLGIQFLRIPAPDAKDVTEAIGIDPYIANKDSEYVTRVIGHRGAGWDAPENSLRAFKLCSDRGCDFIEFDVMLTEDGVPIVFHDATLERMAGLDLVVHECTWDKLSKIDISVTHPLQEVIISWRKKGIRVMTWTVNSPIEKQFVERDLRITYLTDTLENKSSSLCLG